jgi:hypothetical protein
MWDIPTISNVLHAERKFHNDLRILIIPLVSSNSSYNDHKNTTMV